MSPIRHCPACRSRRATVLFEELGYPIARCADCRLVFLGRLPPGAPEERYRRTRYRCPQKDVLFRKHLTRLIRLTKGRRPRLLDVGCASGRFLDIAEDAFEVYGVELSQLAAAEATARHGERISGCSLADAHLPDRFFDAITYWDVLEHVVDIRSEMREVARILKDDGIVVVNLPNASWHLARARGVRLFTSRINTMTTPVHVNHFSVRTLCAFMRRFGLTPINRDDPIGHPTLDRGRWNWAKRVYHVLSVACLRLTGVNAGFTISLYFARRRAQQKTVDKEGLPR